MKIGITTNEILIPKKIFSSTVDKDLELDAPVPEYCPDIARIVKVDCTPFVEGCDVADGKAAVRGRVVYDVLYETDYKNRLRCVSFTQELAHTLALPRTDASNADADCFISCERIGCRLLSPRRLIIKATLGIRLDVEGETTLSALSVNEDESTFFRKKTIGFDGRTKRHTEVFKFGDSLPLAQSEKSIGEIVCGSISLQPPQLVVSQGRAEIRTTATLHALYEEENGEGRYLTTQKSFPITLEHQNGDIEDFKRISVKLEPFDAEFTPELDQYGESRVIKTSFSVGMKLHVTEPKAYTVAEDVFERGYDSTPVMGKVSLPYRSAFGESAFSEEAKIPASIPKAVSLLDASARDGGGNAELSDGGVTVKGVFLVTLLSETAEGITSNDVSLPYSRFFALELPESVSFVAHETEIAEVIPTFHSDGSATVKVIASARISAYSEKEEELVTSLTKRVARESSDDVPSLVFCYPSKGERLWDIAKLYRASPESIRSSNPSCFDEQGVAQDTCTPILIKA